MDATKRIISPSRDNIVSESVRESRPLLLQLLDLELWFLAWWQALMVKDFFMNQGQRQSSNEATWPCCEPTCLCLGSSFELDQCDLWPWYLSTQVKSHGSTDMIIYLVNFYLLDYFLVRDRHPDSKHHIVHHLGGSWYRRWKNIVCTTKSPQNYIVHLQSVHWYRTTLWTLICMYIVKHWMTILCVWAFVHHLSEYVRCEPTWKNVGGDP